MSATNNKIMDDEPEDIEALLPWYATGALNPRDTRRVEEALRQDPGLRKQYAAIQDEYIETVSLNENLGAPSTRALQKLMTAIETEPAGRAPAVAPKRPGRFAALLASLSPRTLAWSASFGALALVLQAGIIGTILMRTGLQAFQSPEYHEQVGQTAPAARTPSSPETPVAKTSAPPNASLERRLDAAPPPAASAPASQPASPAQKQAPPSLSQSDEAPADATVTRPQAESAAPSAVRRSMATAKTAKDVIATVTFQPEARMSDISALLSSYRAAVVGSEGGALRLQFEGMTTASDLNVILAALRKERIVASATAAP